MQLHIRKRNGNDDKHPGYAPMHDARPLTEFDAGDLYEEAEELVDDDLHSWKTSRVTPILIFLAALGIVGGIIYFAHDYSSAEKLSFIRIEGNRSLLTSEITALAQINRDEKFYDIDLRSIESRVEKHPLVRRAVIRRETNPNAIVIHIDEREPIALIRTTSGEPALIDRDHKLFWPKRLTGLSSPERLMSVPLLSGITEKDTLALAYMAGLVEKLEVLSDSAMHGEIGELKRTATGALVIYTASTMTPIFLGNPLDEAFETTLDAERLVKEDVKAKPHFQSQLELLAKLWKERLRNEVLTTRSLYVDARFRGQIIVKRKV
jgi:hypothetical protein